MNSPTFKFRVPIQSKAYSWLKEKQDGGENVSRALRYLIESHGDMFDTLYSRDQEIIAFKRQIKRLEKQDSPDYRGHLRAEQIRLAEIRKADRASD